MSKQMLDALGVIIGIAGGMIGIYLFVVKGLQFIINFFGKNSRKIKALETSAKQFEEELSELKTKHENSQKEVKRDIEILENDYKEIFKILLNRK